MFKVIYVTVTLLQLSFSQELMDDPKTPKDVDTVPIDNDYMEEDLIRYTQPEAVEDDNDTIKANDDNNILPDDYMENDLIRYIRPMQSEAVEDNSDTVTTNDDKNGEYEDTEESIDPVTVTGAVDEELQQEESIFIDNAIPNNAGSSPVKLEDDSTSSGEVPEVPERISFSGCAKAQGKVTVAARFGCGENNANIVTLPECDNEASPKEISDSSVTFDGPVHAQGKIVIGSHYGCGASSGPPGVLPMPWFPRFLYPPIYYSPYPIPGVLQAYPLPIPETGKLKPPSEDESRDGNEDMSDASNLADLVKTEDNKKDMVFNGVVPASGAITIAAKY